ncbi:hypothetical protein [Nitrosarchaeum sp. AC2]|uniref:hypothetical protein n=1 Tax=Nitrosarchaeum sp. AC2 TaxID=2259673 RepID=UPI0015CEE584|nr:hypothetical protein [Nitrosarchaeum sp. AC2]QLH11257.1 hypothetical protein DSQ20_07135 [Nitrosarchaeum sp. AC2]
MRDLRALVQEAMEITCEKKKISLGNIQNKKIINITDKMKKVGMIDDVLYNWFLTFSSGANLSSHKGFPTRKDMQNGITRRRIMTTFFMGTHLISELAYIVNPPKLITVKTSSEFKIKISKKKVPTDKTLHETYDGINKMNI